MENTIENKIRFFTQYWDVRCLSSLAFIYSGDIFPVNLTNIEAVDNDFLILKKLNYDSDIEDLKEIGYTIIPSNLNCKSEHFAIDDAKAWIRNGMSPVMNPLIASSITDLIRSKGYALPYMGLSVEKQVEYGWVKLK